MRLGIFGGTFDPPHIGHLILAMEAYEQLKLDKVLWVIAPNPPHKLGKLITAIDQRIEMVKKAIDDDPMFEFSWVDINRAGPHYVLDTMLLLHMDYPRDSLIYLMGGDSLRDLPTWHKPAEFIAQCNEIGVMRRPGEIFDLSHLKKEFPTIERKVKFIEAPLLEISSHKIRSMVYQKKPFRYYLPEGVYKQIIKFGLYQIKEAAQE